MSLDRSNEGSMRAHQRAGRPRGRYESGQALVEFALVLFPLIVIIGGVIQLGIGIANWHDLNRITYEGARFAATNEWPDCPAAALSCTANPSCDPSANKANRSLTNFLRCEAIDAGLPDTVTVIVCSPAGAGVGEPVTVKLRSRVNFLSLDKADLNVVEWAGVTLRGESTMRVSQPPTHYTTSPC